MAIRYLVGSNLLGAMPLVGTMFGALTAALPILTGELARVGAMASVSIALPDPTKLAAALSAQVGAVVDIVAKLPAARVNIVADASIRLGLIQGVVAAVNAALSISGVLSSGGVYVYELSGPVNSFGPGVSSQLGGGLPTGGGSGYGILIVTESPAAQTGLQALFGVRA